MAHTAQASRSPIAAPNFAPQNQPKNNMRHTHCNPMQKTSTLRRSGSFVFGQQGTQHKGSAATAVYIFSGMPLPRCLPYPIALLPVPKALRPPLHLSKRIAPSVSGFPAMRVRRSPAVRLKAASRRPWVLYADKPRACGRGVVFKIP